MTDPTSPISVVIPSYNRAGTLPRAIQSVLDQTHLPKEIIVVDDGSKDNSEEVVGRYREFGVVYNRLLKNSGANVARNTGAAMATGEFIAFLDSDDEWSGNKLATQLRDIQSQGEGCVLVCTPMVIRTPNLPDRFLPGPVGGDIRATLHDRNCVGSTSVSFVRRSAFLAAGGFSNQLPSMQDWDLWFRLDKIGGLYCSNDAVTIINCDTDNRITRNHKAQLKGLRYIYRSYIRPYERQNKSWTNEFYIHFGDVLLAAGKRNSAKRAFRRSLSRKFRLRSAVSLVLATLPINLETYRRVILLGPRIRDYRRKISGVSQPQCQK